MKYSTTTVECRSPSVIVDNLNNDEDFYTIRSLSQSNVNDKINILNIFDVIIMIELLNDKIYQ